jgi:hypothetical protein
MICRGAGQLRDALENDSPPGWINGRPELKWGGLDIKHGDFRPFYFFLDFILLMEYQ